MRHLSTKLLSKSKIYRFALFLVFSLIDNLQVTYNFTGNSYTIKREKVQELYLNYSKINENGINRNNFNIYLENKMNDDVFVKDVFNEFFI